MNSLCFQVPDGAPAAGFSSRIRTERSSDQDLVPEQKGQNQEGDWNTEPAGPPADGPRPL